MGVVLPQPVQFGKYTLFERIGRGGMADVFKGRVQGPAGFERVFVVKRILPHLSDDPTFTKMFIEEAKLSARLNHPNIVQVFELGNVDAEYFISMEYVKGRDLAETMRTLWARVGPPRPELVAYIGRELCRALAYAHDLTDDDGSPLGMIHRDISPSNVMLSYDGAVKILDFGIAKALGGESKDEGGTQRGTLKGKFAYMAPEQTAGNEVDRRIDIFAAGIVLHEVLTGRRLFKGENDLQTVEKVRQCDVPPPSLQNPLCPPELDAVVLKALSKNREDRFQSAAEMADALDDVVHAHRFQPSHLAQLMRDLFLAEPGADPRTNTGSVRVMTGSGSSRPHSAPMRSPTVPPVAITRSVSTALPTPNRDMSELALPRPKPFFKRASVWLTVGIVAVGFAFVSGGVWMRDHVAPTAVTAGPTAAPKRAPWKVYVSSSPSGADVFIQGESKPRGKTDVVLTLPWKDGPTTLVFKLPGYQDATRDVRPNYPDPFVILHAKTPEGSNSKGAVTTPTGKSKSDGERRTGATATPPPGEEPGKEPTKDVSREPGTQPSTHPVKKRPHNSLKNELESPYPAPGRN